MGYSGKKAIEGPAPVEPRIGVFICHFGTNISGSLDVVAACTPRLHEPTFRRATTNGGLNPFRLEMANIRDQGSWVHMHD